MFVSICLCAFLFGFFMTFVHFFVYFCLVCVRVWMGCLLPGSFDLFSTSNGTSKEDFSEFDSLRSSSSVPTGTHPVFVPLMTRSLFVLFCLPLCVKTCLSADPVVSAVAQRLSVLSLYASITRFEQRPFALLKSYFLT